ncbi:hypothetical protein [Corynebacterium mayonis]|uniref:hypothetical protein n=1 Tax=Corynebacterium mayonis TaxID=3062461 RepID=UPI0031406F06
MIRRTLRGSEALTLAVSSCPAWVVPAGLSLSGRLRIAAEPAARLLAAPWNPAAAVASFEQSRVSRAPSALGVGAVVAAQVAYARRLRALGAQPAWPVALAGVAAVAGGCIYARGTVLAPAVIAGATAHVVTAALANDPGLRTGVPAREGISHGANLVCAAEGLRLVANLGRRRPLLDALVAATGSVGHLLMAQGLGRP